MITVLTWVSIITGGLLVFLLLFSLIGGLDLDLDVGSAEVGSSDVETDAGGIGLIKGFLTFVSVASWVMKILLVTNKNPGMALGVGILSGLIAFFILNFLFKALLKNEENVNWTLEDALFASGEVYLKIPGDTGSGIVNVNVNGANREIKAKTADILELPTGTKVQIVSVEGDFVVVEKLTH